MLEPKSTMPMNSQFYVPTKSISETEIIDF
jgi:hypothetical protein